MNHEMVLFNKMSSKYLTPFADITAKLTYSLYSGNQILFIKFFQLHDSEMYTIGPLNLFV